MPSGNMESPDGRLESARRRGRRLGIALFGLLVSAVTLAWSAQIITQAWDESPQAGVTDCRAGILSLLHAVGRARVAAANETAGERAALERFRRELSPEWEQRAGIGAACRADRQTRRALTHVDELRYAEEHAIRYEAIGLARQRQRARKLEADLTRARHGDAEL